MQHYLILNNSIKNSSKTLIRNSFHNHFYISSINQQSFIYFSKFIPKMFHSQLKFDDIIFNRYHSSEPIPPNFYKFSLFISKLSQ